MTSRKLTYSLFILATFYIVTHLSQWIPSQYLPDYGFSYITWILSIAACWPLLGKRLFSITGLSSSAEVGVLWGLVFVSPMLIGFAVSDAPAQFAPTMLVTKALLPGFLEELMFRGFLVGMLIKVAGWRLLPAALVNAVLFGIGHWFQGATFTEALMASVFTGIGGLWFAWLFVAWRHNLWLVATLHILMNACWVIWQVDTTAIGSQYANLLRLSTMILSITATIFMQRRRGNDMN
ncbi:MAG: CPBP family intramembrane metalloprotease [Gammaproteobacteria bacterium]|nr:CPBP family intramembrane metalloprotease [Gammaproteobacteria bacterium]